MKTINKKRILKTNKTILMLIITLMLILIMIQITSSANTQMALQGEVRDSSGALVNGNVEVHIYTAASEGDLVYNSSNEFNGNITGGYYDIMLGSTATKLNLLYGKLYYMDILIDGEELNFSGDDRKEFYADVGNMSIGNSYFNVDSVAEEAISFTTSCAAGNRLYINAGDLACEAAGGGGADGAGSWVNDSASTNTTVDVYINQNGEYLKLYNEFGKFQMVSSTNLSFDAVAGGNGQIQFWDNVTMYADLHLDTGKYYYGDGSALTGVSVDDNSLLSDWDNITGELNDLTLFGSDPTYISHLAGTNFDSAYDIAIVGDNAYVTSSVNDSLSIIDITMPSDMKLIGYVQDSTQLELARGLHVVGGYAYIAANERMTIVDVRDTSNPVITGSVTDIYITNPLGIYMSGKYVYVAGYTDWKVGIYDVTDHNNPVLATTLSDGDLDYVTDVYVSGNTLVCSSRYGIATFDLDNPSSPTKLDYQSSGMSDNRLMDVDDNFAYLAANQDITVYNISDPSEVSLVETFTDGRLASIEGLYISGNVIYATATGDNALVLVNITNPLNLNFIGEYVDTGFLQDPKHVAIKGNIGFITSATNDSLVAVQLQGIDTPTLNTGTFTTDNGYVSRNLVIGNDLYVDNGMHSGTGGIFTDGGLTVKGKTSKSTFDVDLSYVYSFSNATALDGINGLYIQGDYGYFVRGSIPGGFGIIDMTSKQNLSVISYIESDTNFDNPNTPIAIGDYVFVNSYDDDQVTAVYVGNKTNPVVVDTLKDGTELNGAYHSMVSGNVLYVTGKLGNSVNSIDITDPHNMVFLDQILDNTYLDSPAKFDIQGNYMFVPNYDDNSMTSIDISDPTNMKVVSELIDAASLSTGYEIKVSGRYAYHSGRYGGEITVVDISNPASMKVVYVYNDPSSNYNWKEIVGNRLIYYDNNGNDMFVMDISNPLNWKIERTFDMDGLGAHYTDGRYMYVMYPSGDEIRVYDIGGIDTPALTTGNIQADYGRVSKNFEIGDDLFVHKNLMAGSLNTIGNLNMNGTAFINSKVGIGIRSPTDPLHIKADSGHDNIHLEEHSGIEDWQIGVDADGDLNFEDSGTTVVTFEDGGFVGIGTDDPGRELTVVGDINTTGKIFAYKPTTSDVFTVTADSGHRAFSVFTSGNAQPSMYLLGTGFYMGDGTNPYDIELRRGSANTIYTPDDIGIGMTNTPYSNLWINSTKTTAGLVVARTTTPPLFQALGYGTDNVYLFFDSYYDGGFKSSDSGSNFMISKNSDQFKISHDSGVAVGGANSYDVGFAMKSDGEVLIDKTTDSGAYDLQVNGEICETTAGTQACSSDERLKENIIPLKQENSLDLIMQLEPKEFNFIGDNKTVSGFIAQDIQEIRPDWIIEHDDDEYITFDDKGYMQTSIVKSIQEQQEMIEQQEQLLAQQQTQIDELKTIICIDHPDAEMCK